MKSIGQFERILRSESGAEVEHRSCQREHVEFGIGENCSVLGFQDDITGSEWPDETFGPYQFAHGETIPH